MAHLLSKAVPDLIQIFNLQESRRAPFLDPSLIESMIVQRKDRLNILPLTLFWCYTSPTFVGWTGD